MEHFDVIVVGGGQAALAIGYELAQRDCNFVILDAGERTGDSWRERWDSLVLFTPARYSALPGMSFPAPADHMPHKDEVAEYLESYARRFDLPIRYNQRVTAVRHVSEWAGFTVTTDSATFEADQVVIATGAFHTPLIPPISHALGNDVAQMHSSEYRTPSQIPPHEHVLVVGGGNSGMQIAEDLAATHHVSLSIGKRIPALPATVARRSIFWWLDRLGIMDVSAHSRIGRTAMKREFLIGTTKTSVERAGVRVVGRAQSAIGNMVFTDDDTALEVSAVIWATGFRQNYSWLPPAALDPAGRPRHDRGVTQVSGLYFLGLSWLHTRGSALLGWVGRDAAYLARRICM